MKNDFILGIDYGTKKIGVSLGQMITKTCRPLKIIYKNKNDEIKKIILEWHIKRIIIGYPEYDKKSSIHKEIKNFSDDLKKSVDFNIDIVFHNEIFTSEFARNDFADMRSKGITKKSTSDYDDISASIILQSWINENMID